MNAQRSTLGTLRSVGLRGALLSVVALTLAGCPLPPPVVDPPVPVPPGLAPGVAVEVVDVVFPEDLRPEVIFNLEDGKGNPIALGELTDARFILAYLEAAGPGDTAHYTSYTTSTEDPDRVPNSGDEAVQANYDSARIGGISRNDDGTYTYKFATAVPADFDASLPHQIAGQFRRTYPVDGQDYKFNLAHPFMPDGSKQDVATREIVDTQTCNNCHTRLAVHGDVRRDVQLCIMCHQPQSSDAQSGNSVDFAVMIHKIHQGAELPSVQEGDPYQIIGFGNSVNDYSHVEFPQDIRNCQACHTNAPQSDAYLNTPTLNGCASCHDRTWFGSPSNAPEGFEMHTGGEQVNNQLCSLCHKPTGPAPAPIMEAHLRPTSSPEAPGLALNILDVATAPVEGGQQLDVTFEATDKSGARYSDLTELSSASILVAYPATEIETVVRESVTSRPPGTLTPNANGTFTYRFAALLPDTGDTFAAAMDGRLSFEYRGETYTQGTATNGQVIFTLDGSAPVPRRAIVDDAKCNKCHDDLRAHGDQRVGVDSCVMCHNAGATDAARRPAEAMPPETINFKDMIHRIHSGEELEGDYTVYGFGNTPHDFTEIRFPGLRQECSICHVDGSTDLPLADEVLPTTVTENGELVEQIFANRAACTSCHDGIMPNVHALLQTDASTGIETCAVCHGPESETAVHLVHALAP
ncbi:MAG: OmcA/MtrC family decaheme c-type cytochrome [Candidatus Hydrogenedens sp.]|nr:OmcA/MtrC family decaheme c-type cytochrome [Candidatus Hydrogenedens sp.]